ncbi:helix-turn-helix transcriptional regulator [Streptomyces caniscabiei]|uniref:helix-turn-helix domain-containing protein n=1 Tax=Streptomyces caniscabiei TaxID=2746961 RepID=UPI0029AF7616|nr:helix-turn-helix transcriptional regulator [Streptomyces caniscabiei]MDX3507494.1 helix-turn-helix transcriptional regulator [Streptomyces caniscabiei]
MPKRRNPYPDWVIERRLALGHRIATIRGRRRFSQDDLAETAGVDRRSIQRYEAGTRDPRYADLLLIANALDIGIAELVQDPAAGAGDRPAAGR